MKPRVLFIVTGDPRNSSRPAEAIRIAVGVSVWEKAQIAFYLRGAAILALGESSDELLDEENYTRYLPMLAKSSHPIYVQKDAPALGQLGLNVLPFSAISDAELAQLAARQNYVLHF